MSSIFYLILLSSTALSAPQVTTTAIVLYSNYITRIRCEGKLFISAIGNEALVERQALPKELGCGVLLKPLANSGKTNLILETSTGSIRKILEISPAKFAGDPKKLEVFVKGDQ